MIKKSSLLLSLAVASSLYAGGYKIPETSTDSVALGAANIAHVSNAAASYDNPANMAFMSDTNHLEVNLMYIGLSGTKFDGTVKGNGPYSLTSEEQMFKIPSLHYVSPKLGDSNIRVGFSMVIPGGLTREWTQQPAKGAAEEFTLQVIELNPTMSYAINDEIAIAAGVRLLHSAGIVKSSGTLSRDMEGSSNDFGYNLALAYKPTSSIDLALTYRSNVDLGQEGTAKLYDATNTLVYDGGATVSVPLPAAVSIAGAYTFESETTVEFVYERSFWSSYDVLDFGYVGDIGNLKPYFDDPITKDWVDTSSFRLGVTQELDSLKLMAGLVYDESPTPEKTLNFESPGSDSTSVSFGVNYQLDDNMDIGFAALYSMKEDRTIANNDNGIDGEFTNSNALLISVGLGYRF